MEEYLKRIDEVLGKFKDEDDYNKVADLIIELKKLKRENIEEFRGYAILSKNWKSFRENVKAIGILVGSPLKMEKDKGYAKAKEKIKKFNEEVKQCK